MSHLQPLTNLAAMRRPIRLAPRWALGLVSAMVLASVHQLGAAQDANALMVRKNCMACHASSKVLVGPSFDAIRERYGASDLPYLVNKIRNGGSNVWRTIPMPANPDVSYSEAELMAAAILGVGGYVNRVSPGGFLTDDPPTTGGGANLR